MHLYQNKNILKKKGFSFWALLLVIFWYFGADMLHHKWMDVEPKKRGVIKHDIMGYYAYLPSIFIYGDHKLGFIDDPGFVNDRKMQYLKMENGNRIIQYTSGLAIAYSPFFFMAHAIAPILGQERDGYNWVYQFFLVMSALFYVSLALVFLRKLLLEYFSDFTTAITLILLGLGTNLFYYSVYESVVSHSYGFAFIVFFICMVKKWYKKTSVSNTILLGLIFGFSVLMRPSNVFMLIILVLWEVKSKNDLVARIKFLFGKIPLILLMILFFIIPWIPQLLYWKSITGHFFYNSYEQVGSAFYFDAPQTHKMLFSYRKGWLVYTPMMLVAFSGFYFLYRKRKELFWAFFSYMLVMIYVLSSWWSWWFGGGFGCRAMVDTYGVMAFPLAAIIERLSREKHSVLRYSIIASLAFLLGLQLLQTAQYNHNSIHYVAMDKDAYWHKYFKVKYRGVWPYLSDPDHQLARLGIYYYYDWSEDYDAFRELGEEEGKRIIGAELTSSPKMMRSIKRHANRNDIEKVEALEMVIERVYEKKAERKNLK